MWKGEPWDKTKPLIDITEPITVMDMAMWFPNRNNDVHGIVCMNNFYL